MGNLSILIKYYIFFVPKYLLDNCRVSRVHVCQSKYLPSIFPHHFQNILYEIRVPAVAPLEFDAVVCTTHTLQSRWIWRQ